MLNPATESSGGALEDKLMESPVFLLILLPFSLLTRKKCLQAKKIVCGNLDNHNLCDKVSSSIIDLAYIVIQSMYSSSQNFGIITAFFHLD